MSHTTSKEFVIPVEQPGSLADIAASLARERVNITGLLCEGRGDFSILRMVTDDPEATAATLRSSDMRFRTNDVISVRASDRPGELARLTTKLTARGVGVNAAYTTRDPDGATCFTFAVDDLRSAMKALH